METVAQRIECAASNLLLVWMLALKTFSLQLAPGHLAFDWNEMLDNTRSYKQGG